MKPTLDIEALLESIAAAQTSREKLAADRDAAMRKAGLPFATRIEKADQLIESAVQAAEAWSLENPDEFGTAQSIVRARTRFGWRKGKWACVFAEGVKEADAVDHLLSVMKDGTGKDATPEQREAARWAKMLLVTGYSLDKALLLKFSDDDAVLDLAGDAGISIQQKQTFFVEPIREGQKSKRINAPQAA